MGEWVIGALINLVGSIAINFGTNLLKLGHEERERHSLMGGDGMNGRIVMKPIIYFQAWRIGILFFAFGNCLNFISFGYAAQSLLAALGSVQFVSNIAFAYFILNRTAVAQPSLFWEIFSLLLLGTTNHLLAEKYSHIGFLLYCIILVSVVALHHSAYRKGIVLLSAHGDDLKPYWRMLLPFSYAIVSGAVGSCSVLFAKSLSNLLRLSMSSEYQLHSWFTYCMLLLFLSTAGFWMARLNEGLSLFDAILIVPMFQIAWTFFSICTGFVYFQEYQVFDVARTIMFIVGMTFVFVGISLLAPDEAKGGEVKDSAVSVASTSMSAGEDRVVVAEDTQIKDLRSFARVLQIKAADMVVKAKAACSLTFGLGEDSINASSVLVMPMVSSKITGFRSSGGYDRSKFFSFRNSGWNRISGNEDEVQMIDKTSVLTTHP